MNRLSRPLFRFPERQRQDKDKRLTCFDSKLRSKASCRRSHIREGDKLLDKASVNGVQRRDRGHRLSVLKSKSRSDKLSRRETGERKVDFDHQEPVARLLFLPSFCLK